MTSDIALKRKLSDFVEEYDQKVASIARAVSDFEAAGDALKMAACIGGTWGDTPIDTGSAHERQITDSLLKSAWRHAYNYLQIDRIASAEDKRKFDQALAQAPAFTMDNIRATLGKYIADPRGNILRGLAEVFAQLDPSFKSHDKMKVGVSGLPKRIILSACGEYGGWGRDRIRDILNALAAYQGKPLADYGELSAIWKYENALMKAWDQSGGDKEVKHPARGIRLRRFSNGNGHLFFEPDTLRDINHALAEFYGEVLPDCAGDEPTEKRQSTAVSKDLQYYPTPTEIVESVMAHIYLEKGERVLEPSCGCGRFLDEIAKTGSIALGIEIDPGRAEIARSKGHKVLTANFLETAPTGDFDHVIMNPPFYGKHYSKHVRHALKFLKPGGTLTAILPITARYDHGALDDLISSYRYDSPWSDLPVGSFSESGTNINTTVLTIRSAEP